MTNDERREALNQARRYSYRHVCAAEELSIEADLTQFTRHCRLAEVWASVAQAMKDGDPTHDAPDGNPISPHITVTGGV